MHDIWQRTYALIGEFVVRFSEVEYHFKSYASLIFGANAGTAWFAFHRMDALQLTEVVANIINDDAARVSPLAKRYWAKVISDFRALNVERVNIVHGHWYERPEGGVDMTKAKRGDKVVIRKHYEQPADLQRSIDMANRLNDYIVLKFPSRTSVEYRGIYYPRNDKW